MSFTQLLAPVATKSLGGFVSPFPLPPDYGRIPAKFRASTRRRTNRIARPHRWHMSPKRTFKRKRYGYRKRKFSKLRYRNRRKFLRWKKQRRLAANADLQPWQVICTSKGVQRTCASGSVVPINIYESGCYRYSTTDHGLTQTPFKDTSSPVNYFSDMGVVIKQSTADNLETIPKNVHIEGITWKTTLRNNGNIAANISICKYVPRYDLAESGSNTFAFEPAFRASLINAGITDSGAATPINLTPFDLTLFTQKFKILSYRKIRLLPGEQVILGRTFFRNKIIKTNTMSAKSWFSNYSQMCGALIHGDPAHENVEVPIPPPENTVSTAPVLLDQITECKVKFRLVNNPRTVIVPTAVQDNLTPLVTPEFTSAFANAISSFGEKSGA